MSITDEITAGLKELIPIVAAMGVEIIEAEDTTVAARLPAAPNVNHFGTAYAGSLFTVAEVMGGVFARTSLAVEGGVPLVKRVEIDFLRPAMTDVVARTSLSDSEIERVLAEYAERGKSDFELLAEVTDEAGTVVARTKGLYQLRRF